MLLATTIAVVHAQTTACDPTNTADAVASWIECQTSNVGCSDCEAGESTTPDFSAGDLPSSQEEIEQIFCGTVNCCSACVQQTKAVLQCTADTLCTAFSISSENCQLDCDPAMYPYGDGDAQPDACDTAAGALGACLIREGTCFDNEQDQCLDRLQNLESTLGGDAGNVAMLDNCDIADAYFCTYISCCPGCQDELKAVYDCEIDESSWVADCTELSCRDAIVGGGDSGSTPTEAPVVVPSDGTIAPSVGGGTNMDPQETETEFPSAGTSPLSIRGVRDLVGMMGMTSVALSF
jgi:hypothetical protein